MEPLENGILDGARESRCRNKSRHHVATLVALRPEARKLAETMRSDARRSVITVRAKVELVLDRGSLFDKQMVVARLEFQGRSKYSVRGVWSRVLSDAHPVCRGLFLIAIGPRPLSKSKFGSWIAPRQNYPGSIIGCNFSNSSMPQRPTHMICLSKFPSSPFHGPHGTATDVFANPILATTGRFFRHVAPTGNAAVMRGRHVSLPQSNDTSRRQNPRHHVLAPAHS